MADQLQIAKDLRKIATDPPLIYINQLYSNINYITILLIKSDPLQIMAIWLMQW